VTAEERFIGLRRSAACVHLSREQVSELVAITANLFEERRRIRRLLVELPLTFGEVDHPPVGRTPRLRRFAY
jgi:hypothetical protein